MATGFSVFGTNKFLDISVQNIFPRPGELAVGIFFCTTELDAVYNMVEGQLSIDHFLVSSVEYTASKCTSIWLIDTSKKVTEVLKRINSESKFYL